MPTQAEKCQAFADLHGQREAFIIANPWDAGSALMLQGLGFKALATSSGGFALTLGKADGQPTLDEKLAHCRAVASVTDIPVSADFEDGFAQAPEDVARNVTAVIATGVAGCSIEDFDRSTQQMYEPTEAIERVAAAVEVSKDAGIGFMLTARCEHLLRGGTDLDQVINQLQAYEAAGADVLFAPGIKSLHDLKTITSAVNKPFNVLGVMLPGASLEELQEAGAQRVSIGGSLPFVGAKPILESCRRMLNDGRFDWVANSAPYAELMKLMQDNPK
ncbi:MAG: isocitrate lyase/phosphoenolpyruvate mutase family protein [Pseudomonadota bacterium]